MVTSPYLADVDAAMQVSHAISTHAVNRESDYFTAVDDLIGQSCDTMEIVTDHLAELNSKQREIHVEAIL